MMKNEEQLDRDDDLSPEGVIAWAKEGGWKPSASLHELDRHRINRLGAPILEILRQLRPRIESGAYQLILGDDASGRLPTLLLDRVIRAIYKKNSHPALATRFVAGDAEIGPLIDGYVERLKKEIPDLTRALIVSDYICTGQNLKPIAEALHRADIECDVVALASNGEDIATFLGADIISGKQEFQELLHSLLHGVIKDPGELHAHPVASIMEEGEERDAFNRKLKETREAINVLAEKVLADYLRHAAKEDTEGGAQERALAV